jgi:hypothetical protein
VTDDNPFGEAIALITLAHMPDPEWDKQKAAVAATGAHYGGNKRWILELTLTDRPVETLNALFAIAREYGTEIRLISRNDPAD